MYTTHKGQVHQKLLLNLTTCVILSSKLSPRPKNIWNGVLHGHLSSIHVVTIFWNFIRNFSPPLFGNNSFMSLISHLVTNITHFLSVHSLILSTPMMPRLSCTSWTWFHFNSYEDHQLRYNHSYRTNLLIFNFLNKSQYLIRWTTN